MKTIYVKLTNKCQLKCSHCYNSVCDSNLEMTKDTLNKVRDSISNILKKEPVTLSLHGGEPMIYPDLKYVLNNFIIPLKSEHGDKLDLSLTTNLVYELHSDILDIFHACSNTTIYTSWDHAIRFHTNTQELWESNVKLLHRYGIKTVPIITVTLPLVTEISPSKLFPYFSYLGIHEINFERLTQTGRAEHNKNKLTPTNGQVQAWLHSAYQNNKYYYKFKIPLFTALENAVKGNLEGCRARRCTHDVITYNPDGTIATCPNTPNQIIGNVFSNEPTLEQNRCKICLQNDERLRDNRCYSCKFFRECNGDCFQLEFDSTGCPGLPQIIEEIKNENSLHSTNMEM